MDASSQFFTSTNNSQEEELLLEGAVERADVIGDALWVVLGIEVLHNACLLREADACEKISNFVRVHAWSRHLDGACPIEIVMT